MEISVDNKNEIPAVENLSPAEGWHALHLFYQLDHAQWQLLTEEEMLEAKTVFTRLAQEIRAAPDTQLLVFSIVTPKADIGFMLLTPDLHDANAFEKKLNLSLGPDILTPVFSYLSLTERSEYTATAKDYAATLRAEENLEPGSEAFKKAMRVFEEEIESQAKDCLYPKLPDWPVFCFYNLNFRRGEIHNWYSLDFAARQKLMSDRAAVVRKYAGKVRQLVTGSTGLDDTEWGVSLFANDSIEIKRIVSDLRFNEVGAKFADFGDFYLGIQLPLDELFRRVGL